MTVSNNMASPAPPAPPAPRPTFPKGSSDWREYKPFTLPNGVTCLAVSDAQSKTTAASVCVNAGAASDPRELSGIAHFTEHMCFLGSEKYPGENEYKRYLSSRGGRSNASTSMHFTTYKFDVLAEYAEGAFDIFSNFFVRPLFTESGTEREVNAVDSENSKNVSTDGRRRLQVLKAIADPHHYYSKFSTGHKGTLDTAAASADPREQVPVRAALLAFHKRHYVPSNMVCVMVGPQPLHQLEEWMSTRFGAIPPPSPAALQSQPRTDADGPAADLIARAARDAPIARWQSPTERRPQPPEDSAATAPLPFNPPFKPSVQHHQWPVLLTTLPLRNMRRLFLLFPLPSAQSIPNASPLTLASHLLGHEGPHSSFALLQDKGWIESLSTGPRISASDHTLFQITVGLTQEGEAHWKHVIAVLFHHCRLLSDVASKALTEARRRRDNTSPTPNNNNNNHQNTKAYQDLQRIWNEIAKIRSIDFHMTSPGAAYTAAPNIAESIMVYGLHQCLTAGSQLLDLTQTNHDGASVSNGDDSAQLAAFISLLERFLDFTERLNPDNCIVERCSPAAWRDAGHSTGHEEEQHVENDHDNDTQRLFGFQKEKWYGVEYHLSPIDQTTVQAWKRGPEETQQLLPSSSPSLLLDGHDTENTTSSLRLPKPNRYLPRTLELCSDLPEEAKLGPRIDKDIDPPQLLLDTTCSNDDLEKATRSIKGRLWHRLDDRYALPKSQISILFRNAAVKHSKNKNIDDNATHQKQLWHYDEVAAVKSIMLTSMFSNAMSQEMYDADLAGASSSLSTSAEGLVLRCGGYSDRLPDLALKVMKTYFMTTSSSKAEGKGNDDNQDYPSLPFITEQYFVSAKDRLLRWYQSYLQSGRADSHAMYYINLLTSNGQDVETSIDAIEALTLDSLKNHHRDVLLNDEMEMECFFTGNVGQVQALNFFQSASKIMDMALTNDAALTPLSSRTYETGETDTSSSNVLSSSWVPGSFERRLNRGEDIELHFSSKNSEEENGAVQMIFQSPKPGFKGEALSTEESLKFSSALRLLCHILREPLFDELRTKQQIGYVVSSYFDINFSVRQQQTSISGTPENDICMPETTTSESIVINILSKKFPPAEVAARVDEFLLNFRKTLSNMPLSEIEDHATSLSVKLKKPIQKLGVESSNHFGKIRRYGSEVLANGASAKDVPWNSVVCLANSIKCLNRVDLLMVWDTVVTGEARSRIVSHVYGKTFPMIESKSDERVPQRSVSKPFETPTMLNSLNGIMRKRVTLKPYGRNYSVARTSTNTSTASTPYFSKILKRYTSCQLVGLAGVSLVGVGVIAMVLPKNSYARIPSKERNT